LELVDVAPEVSRLAGTIDSIAIQDTTLAGSFDIQPGGEGTVAGAGQNNGPHIRVARQLLEKLTHLEPHGLREGVELVRPVDFNLGHKGSRRGHHIVLVVGVSC